MNEEKTDKAWLVVLAVLAGLMVLSVGAYFLMSDKPVSRVMDGAEVTIAITTVMKEGQEIRWVPQKVVVRGGDTVAIRLMEDSIQTETREIGQ